MYYVIKRQHSNSLTAFISFQVPKYIASKNSENVIFEFQKDGKPDRKWIKKSDIILLTDDKKFFIKTVAHFKEVEEAQQKLIDAAQAQLDQSIENFTEAMNAEIDEFSEIRDSSDVPCILKEL
jgi:predicted transcriptional regulator